MERTRDERELLTITRLVADLFEVTATHRTGNRYTLAMLGRYGRLRGVKILHERLRTAGYTYRIDDSHETVLLEIDPVIPFRIPSLNLLLFLLTLLSVYVVPVFLSNLSDGYVLVLESLASNPPSSAGEPGGFMLTIAAIRATWELTLTDLSRGAGIEFTLAMISILLVHEMGHYIAGRRRDIVTSWPYFIPAPNIIGTFGAIIKSKSPFWNRRDLLEVGAAGPIAGWIVALGWLWYGLTNSSILPVSGFQSGQMSFSLEGESILMRFLAPLIIGPLPIDHFYLLSEAAFAGWVGLLVTAINLLPIGQLDGGHILYGLGTRSQFILGRIALAGLFVLGFSSPTWWLFAGMGLVFGVKHPPTLDDSLPPSRTATAMGIVSLVILFLSFTPIPFR